MFVCVLTRFVSLGTTGECTVYHPTPTYHFNPTPTPVPHPSYGPGWFWNPSTSAPSPKTTTDDDEICVAKTKPEVDSHHGIVPPSDDILRITKMTEDGETVQFRVRQEVKDTPLEWVGVEFKEPGSVGPTCHKFQQVAPGGIPSGFTAKCSNMNAVVTVIFRDAIFANATEYAAPQSCGSVPAGQTVAIVYNVPCNPGCGVEPLDNPEPTSAPTTLKPTPSPTRGPTKKPSAKPTTKPTKNPTSKPTKKPVTAKPTNKPTGKPTSKPVTAKPTNRPTRTPTKNPTKKPTTKPTPQPTRKPTTKPTPNPAKKPTVKPTGKPTKTPTKAPTGKPTKAPTRTPTGKPTSKPTTKPTKAPTKAPTTKTPTKKPTKAPTKNPTKAPTKNPTKSPTRTPTKGPTKKPSSKPTGKPTGKPTKKPTSAPTVCVPQTLERVKRHGAFEPAGDILTIVKQSADGTSVKFAVSQEWKLTALEWVAVDFEDLNWGKKCGLTAPAPTGLLPTQYTAKCYGNVANVTIYARDDCFSSVAPITTPSYCGTSGTGKIIMVNYKVPCSPGCPGYAPLNNPVPTTKPTTQPTRAPTKKPTKKPTKVPTKKPSPAPTKKPTLSPVKACVPATLQEVSKVGNFTPADAIISNIKQSTNGTSVTFTVNQWWKLTQLGWVAVEFQDVNWGPKCTSASNVNSGPFLAPFSAKCVANYATVKVYANDDCFSSVAPYTVPSLCSPCGTNKNIMVEYKIPCSPGC